MVGDRRWVQRDFEFEDIITVAFADVPGTNAIHEQEPHTYAY